MFCNFIGENIIIMKTSKPLNQANFADASALNLSTKVVNNSESRETILSKLLEFASSVPDFRRSNKGNIRHRLNDIIMLMILARASDRVGRADTIEFGKKNIHKLQKMGMFKNGIPSEPTLCRIEKGIDAHAMVDKMREFAESFRKKLHKDSDGLEIICVDGKAMRGTVQQNGRNPDIVSAYSPATRIILATEACEEKSNEIKAVPRLLWKIDITGKVVTADAMSFQKPIIDLIRERKGYFFIELKANQRALCYRIEDAIKEREPLYTHTPDSELAHGRIETRIYNVYDGLDMIADTGKWGGNLTVVEYISDTVKKSTNERTIERRLYLTNLPTDTPTLGSFVRTHWLIESMHWALDVNFCQDKIKRKHSSAARNLDTIQRVVYSVYSIWKGLRKKVADKRKGVAELKRHVSTNFTTLINFLSQN